MVLDLARMRNSGLNLIGDPRVFPPVILPPNKNEEERDCGQNRRAHEGAGQRGRGRYRGSCCIK